MMRKAIFPGSFDPFTLGHLDVVTSALRIFDEVIIAIGYNSAKKGFFNLENRIRIIEASVAPLRATGHQIRICQYNGLTIDLCEREGVYTLIRGLRTTADFEQETIIAQANKKLNPDVETVFIPASQRSSFLSSTVVRDVLLHHGDTSIFVAPGINLEDYR